MPDPRDRRAKLVVADLRPKVIIWDIDGTLWDGVIDDSVAGELRQGAQLVPALTERGLVNSICSYNETAKARRWLEQHGLADYIVFEQISWEDKASAIRRMLAFFNVAAESVVVVDDDLRVRERLAADLGVTTLAPNDIETADLDSWGDESSGTERLGHYRVLERRWKTLESHRANSPGNDLVPFLRDSRITVTPVDVVANSGRIAELSQRSNRLNLTSSRIDPEAVEELSRDGGLVSRAFRVADRFGDYGLCGYLVVEPSVSVKHLLWSCRVVNQGVVEAVADRIRTEFGVTVDHPALIEFGREVDWISGVDEFFGPCSSIVEPAEADHPPPVLSQVCLVGGCDMDLVAAMWPPSEHLDVLVSGLTSADGVQQYGQSSLPLLVGAAAYGEESLRVKQIPWIGAIPSVGDWAEADLVVISLWVDYSCSTIRHPEDPDEVCAPEYIRLTAYSDDAEWGHWLGQSMCRTTYLGEFMHGPALTASELTGYVAKLAELCSDTTVALIGGPELCRDVSYPSGDDQYRRNKTLNEAVAAEVRKHSNLVFVDMSAMVDGVGQLASPDDPTGFHYRRDVYARMAIELSELHGEARARAYRSLLEAAETAL
ncbi:MULTISPECIES: hypothetical protein [unclassified Gordonia (in: high G+C Gram-positive bacteria)]|mgnify:CR=1 FL=1|uniref:hypothetical protein n=1 Tax=Gordonia TaxID=2053 RepID=UPI0010FA1AA8|nr:MULTISPECIES: hypothetical protein [unclassified Gordonia (in: high G+C Gram-positive bacteria)]MBN0973311.1 hypothetical protein [Gordonia sp. BP-119]MBN0983344.1 hypothetical protein [Gordonia sp. BP-94]MBR7194300.1 hypothetical protein [Gordonia sp. SCSIO 19800]MDT0221940.1 hypothetical protein [Gordonia sp. AC31]